MIALEVAAFIMVFLVSAGLLVFQHLHYSAIIKDLMNRLMSKNYGEFVSAEAFKVQPAKPGLDVKAKEIDNEPDSVETLNQIL